MERPDSRYVKMPDGVFIGYQVYGNGPYDLLVNDGWLSNVDANWDLPDYAALLRALGRRARLVMFDRRGFGISDRPTATENMTLEKAMEDAIGVMDAVGSERAVLMGVEAGAAVSILLAASYPERVTGLVLQAPTVVSWRSAEYPWGMTPEWSEMFRGAIEKEWGTEEFMRKNFEDMNDPGIDADALRTWARWSRLAASPQAALSVDAIESEIDIRPLLPQVRVPTLVIQAEADVDDQLWGGTQWVAEQIPGARYALIAGAHHILRATDTEAFDELDRFVAGIREQEEEFDRVLGTVMFTDIVGSTQKAAELGDRAWRDLLERHHSAVRAMLARFRGAEIDTAGDGFFATFDGPARAVRCAQATVEAVRPIGLEIRAGVHTGELETIDSKVGGMGVVIGARIGAKAGSSEVLVSQTVKDLVAGSGLVFEDAGEHELKGVPETWKVYRVVA
ncbi:MAG: alpha/beta fold hydrolase [Actinomycetota bacterium]